MTAVDSSLASADSTDSVASPCPISSGFSSSMLIVNTMSSAVNGIPSFQVTPSRTFSTSVRLSFSYSHPSMRQRISSPAAWFMYQDHSLTTWW